MSATRRRSRSAASDVSSTANRTDCFIKPVNAQPLCRGSLATLSTETRTRTREAESLKQLLAREDREPWTRAQLERVIGGNPLDLSDALHNLSATGVIHLSEEHVSVSRAASRTARLITMF
jgi:hypothetical protein